MTSPLQSPNRPLFTTMGMFIIDTIEPHPTSNSPTQENVVGGGGTFATLGSRIIATGSRSQGISWIVDEGSDFPKEVKCYLNSWNTSVIFRKDATRLTTRGWNGYVDEHQQTRSFRYLSPKKQIVIDDILNEGELIRSRSFHLICSPQRAKKIAQTIRDEHVKHYGTSSDEPQPVIAWEPVPDACTPENLQDLLEVLPLVDIFTPNAEEAARLLGLEEPTTKEGLESLALRYNKYLTYKNDNLGSESGIVLRCGALGCYTLTFSSRTYSWFHAYHKKTPQLVKDPTGGGNTFIGAFVTGFVLSMGHFGVASICGNLGAAVGVEQIGMPVFERDSSQGDIWGKVSLKSRIDKYLSELPQGDETGLLVENILKSSFLDRA